MINTHWKLELNREQIVVAQVENFILKQVKDWLRKGRPPRKTKDLERKLQGYAKLWEQLSLDQDGSLMISKYYPLDLILGKRKKIVVPHELYGEIICGAHDIKAAGHFTMASTLTRLKVLLYFPGMRMQIQHHIAKCEECLYKYASMQVCNNRKGLP